MAVFIYRKHHFMKILDDLRKAGGKASLVVERAEEIMNRLAARGRVLPGKITPHTRHRDVRIAGIRKFDLGGGYRLVYIKKGGHLILLYVGTHDDCTCWIGNNRDIDPGADGDCRRVIPDDGQETNLPPLSPDPKTEPDYDDILLERIDEKTLRRVFSGLCGESEGAEKRRDDS